MYSSENRTSKERKIRNTFKKRLGQFHISGIKTQKATTQDVVANSLLRDLNVNLKTFSTFFEIPQRGSRGKLFNR